MKLINTLIRYIFAEDDDFSLEDRLFLSSIVVGILTSTLGSLINFLFNTSLTSVIIPIGISVLLIVIYYFMRIKKIIKPFTIPIIVIALIGISIIWIFNGGLDGSNILPAFVILILSLISVSNKAKTYVILTFLFLTISIYLIQFFKPDLITKYSNERDRWFDAIFTLIYSSIFIFLIIKYLHQNYTLERLKVEENEKKLAQLNADKDIFISILAHDLKSPFNSILGFLGLLKANMRKYDIERIEKQISTIHKSAQNTYNLLEDILTWANTQSGKIPFEPQKINLFEINVIILDILKENAKAKNIQINNNLAYNTFVWADSNMLKTVLRNLVSNAIKFTENNGNITIMVEETPTNHIISVTDTGLGMDTNKVSRLFDFSKKESTKGTLGETGTGLGLVLCKEFIEKHSGNIWVESELGKGTTFFFTLPNKLNFKKI